jgi:hypothetical protein
MSQRSMILAKRSQPPAIFAFLAKLLLPGIDVHSRTFLAGPLHPCMNHHMPKRRRRYLLDVAICAVEIRHGRDRSPDKPEAPSKNMLADFCYRDLSLFPVMEHKS